jgi:DNA-binding response OmpR family regulator
MIEYSELYKLTSKLTILYIEDDVDFKEETCEILESLFRKVIIADDGMEGLVKYKKYFDDNHSFIDLVVSDVNMPRLNGVELTKEIYKLNPEQFIIIISAYNDSDHLLEFVNVGIEYFLTKPLDLDTTMQLFYDTSLKILEKKDVSGEKSIIELNSDFYWNKKESLLYCKDSMVKLTFKERSLMQLFIKNQNKITTNDEIFNYLWEDIEFASAHNLKCIVSRLRKKLPNLEIENISKLGYKLKF